MLEEVDATPVLEQNIEFRGVINCTITNAQERRGTQNCLKATPKNVWLELILTCGGGEGTAGQRRI